MSDPLTIGILKKDVQTQMAASREVLDAARRLQQLAATESNASRRSEIEALVRELLTTGSRIVSNAREVGQQVARSVGAWP